MSESSQPAQVGSNAGLGPLVACPFCGKQDGYKLAEGDTYRWWLVQCKACGAGVAECHSDRRTQAGTELPDSWMAAHAAWNEAGKHAHELRQTVRALAALNAWHHFGDCRAWTAGPILSPLEADELARLVLRA